MSLRFLTLGSLSLMSLACATTSIKSITEESAPEFVLSSAIADNLPVDVIEGLGHHDDDICVWTRWHNLPKRELEYVVTLKDESGKTLNVSDLSFVPDDPTFLTHSCYKRAIIDNPGTWSWTVSLDDAQFNGSFIVKERRSAVLGALKGGLGEVPSLSTLSESTQRAAAALLQCRSNFEGEISPFVVVLDPEAEFVRVELGEAPSELSKCVAEAMSAVPVPEGLKTVYKVPFP